MTCTNCGTDLAPTAKFCSTCGQPIGSDATTRLSGAEQRTMLAPGSASDAATRLASGGSHKPSSSSGWLTSSGSIDHGRFAPGAILDGRYRIIGLLGKGGMGEVYRADDLRLGQPVALKFLPEALARDSARLAQFHNEVRTARQVSHPNICRVYDIGEVDPSTGSGQGLLYLSMEYVDGEDLATSLRRIGRFPEDRAVEIVRQLCAGLAAAHDRGVLHRDLKPANVMLDGAGKVRLMDFGLAAVGRVDDIRAGTPAYMSPEQLEGREVTARSDIFALGLVMYELFTGRRAFTAKTVAELVAQQEAGTLTMPTAVVAAIDPAVERAIVRCLEPDPQRRPASALAVSAALPGGDPLAAALAAGETPSPEMVAAAGGEGATMTTSRAMVWLAATIALMLAVALMADRVTLPARVPLTKPVEVLVDHAQELRRLLGYTDPIVADASGLGYDTDFLNWAVAQGWGGDRWTRLAAGRPPAILFWYRTSPMPMVPFDDNSSVGVSDPPLLLARMTLVRLDPSGRLLHFQAIPPQIEMPIGVTGKPVEWAAAFTAADLDLAKFTEISPEWTPRMHSDERRAWTGPLPDSNGLAVRVEAAAYRGRVVSFDVIGPWTRASRQAAPAPTKLAQLTGLLGTYIVGLLPIAAGWIAFKNVRSGRADQRGAIRLMAFVFTVTMLGWFLRPHIDPREEVNRMFAALSVSLFSGVLVALLYLAIEPFVRRTSPQILITWTRVLSGRIVDPRVGRDLLIGAAAGAAGTCIGFLFGFLPTLIGLAEPLPDSPDLSPLRGLRWLVPAMLDRINWSMQDGMFGTLAFVLVGYAVRRLLPRGSPRTVQGLTIVATMFVVLAVALRQTQLESGYLWFEIAFRALTVLIFVALISFFGLFATTVSFFVSTLLGNLLITLDSSRLYAGASWLVIAVVLAIAIAGLRMATRSAYATIRPAKAYSTEP